MDKKFVFTKSILSLIGMVIAVMIYPLVYLFDRYFELMELFGFNGNTFAIMGICSSILIFYFLYKNGDKFFSAIIFSVFYYFFVPTGIIQLMFYDTTDGQIAFMIFPIFIVFSILLFFILKLFEYKTD